MALQNNVLFHACMLAVVIYAVSAFPAKESNAKSQDVLTNEAAVESPEMEKFEATLIKYLDLLSKKKLQEQLNQRKNLEVLYDFDNDNAAYERLAKRNPEFTNSLMLYSKLFKKLDQIGKRR